MTCSKCGTRDPSRFSKHKDGKKFFAQCDHCRTRQKQYRISKTQLRNINYSLIRNGNELLECLQELSVLPIYIPKDLRDRIESAIDAWFST